MHKMLRKLEDTFYLTSKKERRLGLLTGKPMKNTSARCESFSYFYLDIYYVLEITISFIKVQLDEMLCYNVLKLDDMQQYKAF